KQELLDAAWPETHVIDTALNIAIGKLRHALGDDPKQPRFIETVHRRGFRWIGDRSPASSVLSPEPGSQLVTRNSALSTQDSALSTDFVGRSAAVEILRRCYTRAAHGQRQLVFVTGEAGIGKTSLVEYFLAQQADACLAARGQCVESYGAGDAYRP